MYPEDQLWPSPAPGKYVMESTNMPRQKVHFIKKLMLGLTTGLRLHVF